MSALVLTTLLQSNFVGYCTIMINFLPFHDGTSEMSDHPNSSGNENSQWPGKNLDRGFLMS